MFSLRPYRRTQIGTWDPFSEMEDMARRFFGNDFFSSPDLAAFKTDVTDEGDHYLLKADLPGFKKEDIHLNLDGDTLTINAERHSEHEQKDQRGKFVCCERSYGSFSRSFDMSSINVDAIETGFVNGVLELKLPKKTEDKPVTRQIPIN